MAVFKGDKIEVETRQGVFEVTGFSPTHYFAKDRHGVVYRFKRSKVKSVTEKEGG